MYGLETANLVYQDFKWTFISNIQGDSFDLTLDLKVFNNAHGLTDIDNEDEDSDIPACVTQSGRYDAGNGPTGHGDICYSDAGSGL